MFFALILICVGSTICLSPFYLSWIMRIGEPKPPPMRTTRWRAACGMVRACVLWLLVATFLASGGLAALVFAENLKEDTATQYVIIGPFLTTATGYTPGTALTIAQGDIWIMKNGGVAATKHQASSAVHRKNGEYVIELDATDTDTAGNLHVSVKVAGYLHCRKACQVFNTNVFDSLYAAAATDYLQTDQVQLGGATQSATDLKDFADTGYDPTNHKAQSDLIYIHGTALSETAGQLAGRFVNFFDQASASYNISTSLASYKATGFSTHDAAAVVTALGTGGTLTDCATATGFSTHDAAAVVTALGTGGTLTDCATATGFSTHNAAAVVTALGTGGTLTDCATATGFSTHNAAAVVTALGTGSTLTAVPYNSAWDAEIQSEVTDALTAYDPPTNAEMEARTLVSGSYSTYAASDDVFLLQETTVATLATQTSFTLTAGSTADDSYNNLLVILLDAGDSTVKSVRRISDYTGGTKTVTLRTAPDFTLAVGDTVRIFGVRDTVIYIGP